jgi:anti-sigma B factor antagonist
VEHEFAIADRHEANYSVVEVSGEVDVASAPLLQQRFLDVVEGTQSVVIIDLLGVTFIDSTGLGVLIGAQDRSEALRKNLRIVLNAPQILKVFEITGLDGHFQIYTSVALAVEG